MTNRWEKKFQNQEDEIKLSAAQEAEKRKRLERYASTIEEIVTELNIQSLLDFYQEHHRRFSENAKIDFEPNTFTTKYILKQGKNILTVKRKTTYNEGKDLAHREFITYIEISFSPSITPPLERVSSMMNLLDKNTIKYTTLDTLDMWTITCVIPQAISKGETKILIDKALEIVLVDSLRG